LGGLNDGLFSVTYQSVILAAVANPEIPPMDSGIKRQIRSVIKILIDFIAD